MCAPACFYKAWDLGFHPFFWSFDCLIENLMAINQGFTGRESSTIFHLWGGWGTPREYSWGSDVKNRRISKLANLLLVSPFTILCRSNLRTLYKSILLVPSLLCALLCNKKRYDIVHHQGNQIIIAEVIIVFVFYVAWNYFMMHSYLSKKNI